MRGVQRALGVHRHTLAIWLLELIVRLPAFRTSVKPAQSDDVLELDELWSFVGQRRQKRWLWVALRRRTRQIVAFVIGDRSAKTCRKLWKRIPKAYQQCRSFSDFWHAYQQVINTGKHSSVGGSWVRSVQSDQSGDEIRRDTFQISPELTYRNVAAQVFLMHTLEHP